MPSGALVLSLSLAGPSAPAPRLPPLQLSLSAPTVAAMAGAPAGHSPPTDAPKREEPDPDAGYVPWLIGAHSTVLSGLVLVSVAAPPANVLLATTLLPATLLVPPIVHLSYGEVGRAAGTLVGSTVTILSGALLLSAADPGLTYDCSDTENPGEECDFDIFVGAMVGEALWATLDITDVIWNPRRPEGATSGLRLGVFPTSRGLRVAGVF
jgi:hypothetical protein